MKKVAITGASGLLGQAITPALRARGCEVVTLSRTAGPGRVPWNPEGSWDATPLEGCDGVIHLAGENIGQRWTPEKKERIRASRVDGTASLCKALLSLASPPPVFVSASAIGLYGNRGDELLSEDSARGKGFLSDVVSAWEEAAQPFRDAGTRVVSLRLGMVLAEEGGALAKMLTPFRLGAGGPIGSGKQYMSWVAREDAARAFVFALEQQGLQGACNVVAPQPVRNAEFTKILGRVLGRPALLRAPASAVRVMFGEMADELLLSSTRVEPGRLLEAGFTFQYPDLEKALRAILG